MPVRDLMRREFGSERIPRGKRANQNHISSLGIGDSAGRAPMNLQYENPFYSLQREMNRLMDTFFEGRGLTSALSDDFAGAFLPQIDLKEEDQAFVVSAELPGMDEKDVEVLLSGDTLTIKGEKKQEKEEKGQNYHRVERHYGSFNRAVTLPADVLTDKVNATFEKGILRITLPKAEKKQEAKKIPIKG